MTDTERAAIRKAAQCYERAMNVLANGGIEREIQAASYAKQARAILEKANVATRDELENMALTKA